MSYRTGSRRGARASRVWTGPDVGQACAALMCVAALAACGNSSATANQSPAYQTSAPSPSAQAAELRGQVVSTMPAIDAWASRLPAGTRATRINYRSTSGLDGSSTTVTGAVFIPPGSWPSGGWPLIAYAHGTTGLTRSCAPSDQPDMFGDLHAVNAFVSSGYAVVTTDYQGLGVRADEDQPHPYLEPRTAAYNVIDAVRAARSIEPTIGDRWLVSGASQGGAAAWSTAELIGSYGGGAGRLSSGQLLGAVALAPVLDLSFLVDRAYKGTMTTAQRILYPIVVSGAANSDPSIHPADYMHGVGPAERAALVTCAGGQTALSAVRNRPAASAYSATSAEDRRLLQSLLHRFSLTHTAASVPILAIYGTKDDIINVDIMELTLDNACAAGENVTRLKREGQGHSLDPGPQLGIWISNRFKGQALQRTC